MDDEEGMSSTGPALPVPPQIPTPESSSHWNLPNLPVLSFKLNQEESRAGSVDDQRENPQLCSTETQEEGGTPTPKTKTLPINEDVKPIKVPKNFPLMLYALVEKWGMWNEDGVSFYITDSVEFSRILSENRGLRQPSFPTFIEMLNTYGLIDINTAPGGESQVYRSWQKENLFQRNDIELLPFVRPRSSDHPGWQAEYEANLPRVDMAATLPLPPGVTPLSELDNLTPEQIDFRLKVLTDLLKDLSGLHSYGGRGSVRFRGVVLGR